MSIFATSLSNIYTYVYKISTRYYRLSKELKRRSSGAMPMLKIKTDKIHNILYSIWWYIVYIVLCDIVEE